MRQTTPVSRISKKSLANHLFIGKHIPKTEFSFQPPVPFFGDGSGNQRLSINHPPVFEPWHRIWIGNFLNEGCFIQRPKQA